MHRITRRLGDVSAQRPKRVVALWLVVPVAFGVLSGAAGGTPVDDFVAPGSQSAHAQQLLLDRFPDAANGRWANGPAMDGTDNVFRAAPIAATADAPILPPGDPRLYGTPPVPMQGLLQKAKDALK